MKSISEIFWKLISVIFYLIIFLLSRICFTNLVRRILVYFLKRIK